ncbi:DUF3040 domain-containing protein [Actinoplanes sp. N902-109]|uniref:DUF3040 domain-containing protein n=1 Tax=Actinoplanes sp. (strain N902-109) TaxID=649831 RepID=UPI0005A006EC|nr:DUF3040 domain-containing protein [Actinoplanes sp. N902-109]
MRALHDIELHLTHEDPAFATRMRGPQTGPRPFPTVFVGCALLYLTLPIEALLLGWIVALVTLLVAVVLLVLLRQLH